jgi:hypothetical protein
LPYPNIPSLSFLWSDSANGIAVRQFCPQESRENGFNVDHREDRTAEGVELGERQQLAERPESVLSLLAPCIRLILLEAPQFGLLPNQASHAYILISSSSFASFSKSN